MPGGLVGDSLHLPFCFSIQDVADEQILRLSTKNFNRPVDDRLWYARHTVLASQVWKFSGLDRRCGDVWTGRRKSIGQADRLGTKRSRRCDENLDIQWPVERSSRHQAFLTQPWLALPDQQHRVDQRGDLVARRNPIVPNP